jgi:hypothetical protein
MVTIKSIKSDNDIGDITVLGKRNVFLFLADTHWNIQKLSVIMTAFQNCYSRK